MPKTKLKPPPPDDVPIWDALVAELDDPRPYEPIVIGTVTVDDAGYDDTAYLDARVDVDAATTDAVAAFDAIEHDARQLLVATRREFYDGLGLVDPELANVRPIADATVLTSVTGTLDLLSDQLDQTQELPRWPST